MNIIVRNQSLSLKAKLIILAIPVIIFTYLIAVNFLIDQDFNYFYDIGSSEDLKKPYLGPLNRTSDVIHNEDVNYRDMTHRLIYFSIPFTKGSESIETTVMFKTDLISSFSLGIKNNTGWNYTWVPLGSTNDSTWKIADSLISLESAYPENNRLSIALDFQQLSMYPNMTYSIDWINITTHKPGLFG